MRVGVPDRVQRAARAIDQRIATSNAALWLAAFAPLLLLYLVSLRTNPEQLSSDPQSVTSSAWQLAHHGTPRLPASTPNLDQWMIPSGDGYIISNRAPGLIGLAAISYCAMPWVTIFNVAPASIAAAIVTSAAIATLALVFVRLCSPRVAIVAALIAGTGTTTWAVSGTAMWPHGPDQLYVAVAMLALAAGRSARAGLAFALAVITRPPLGAAAAVMGIWTAWSRRSFRQLAVIGGIAACGLAAFLAYSRAFWGGGLQSQYTSVESGTGDFTGNFLALGPSALGDFAVNVVGTLISPGRGVLIGAPFLVAVLPGLRAAWHKAPDWVRSSAVGGLLYLGVQLKANQFGGGSDFWSYRYPLEPLTLLAPLLVLAWHEYTSRTAKRRAVFSVLVVVAIAFQAVGALLFRRKDSYWWSFGDFSNALSDHPVAGVTILSIGYVAAAVIYRRVSTAGASAVAPSAPQPVVAER